MKECDDPMRVGDEDYMTPSQQFRDVMKDFDSIFAGRPLPKPTRAEEQAKIEYWRRILAEDAR
jgi:hypothetical protein